MSRFNNVEGHHMNMRMLGAVALTIPLAFGTSRLFAQGQSAIHIPDSSVEQPGDQGQRAHTNHVIALRRDGAANGLGPGGGIRQQIRSAYGVPALGGSGTIAIVDAFDYPTAVNDFNVFSTQFGLPTEPGDGSVLQVVYAKGRPRSNCGWAQESALDIQWAHATAPYAKIVLVLAKSNSFSDLFDAVNFAESLPDVAQVSMSWGGSEFSTEVSFDNTFDDNKTYFAASGDTGGATIYPGVRQRLCRRAVRGST